MVTSAYKIYVDNLFGSLPAIRWSMIRQLIVFIFIVSFQQIYGQDSLADNKFCLKIAPLSLLDIYSGTSVRVGVEYKLKKNFALYNEVGTYIPNANGMQNNYGGLVKIEFKTYLNRGWQTSGSYFSAELFYKYQSYYTYDSIYSPPKYSKDYYVAKDVGCFTLKYGFLKVLQHNLVIDGFFGLGVRQRFVTNTLTSDENKNILPDNPYNTNRAKNQAGIYTWLNMDAGIKIGYSFK